ncbi:MAPK regulated corepressor interacting protein 2 isoform X2 [Cavia porcellus]|uniref:MAPK regulated corepressor interacting protein 2 isoform X2 n=1 Tax=Cavia porcellus TaxID=10141 RepID=UPI002FE1B580
MYTITKGPSKLVSQRRTGATQQQVETRLGELLKCRQPAPTTSPPPRAQPSMPRPGPWPLASQGPRLVFNRVNGRRPLATSPSLEGTQETYTMAHEENVRFVSEDFVPIDLDEWWAQQFLARITNCS